MHRISYIAKCIARNPLVDKATVRLVGKETRPFIFYGNGPSVGASELARNSASRRRWPRATFPNLRRPSHPHLQRFPICNDHQQSRRGNKAPKRNRDWGREFCISQRVAVLDAAESRP